MAQVVIAAAAKLPRIPWCFSPFFFRGPAVFVSLRLCDVTILVVYPDKLLMTVTLEGLSHADLPDSVSRSSAFQTASVEGHLEQPTSGGVGDWDRDGLDWIVGG